MMRVLLILLVFALFATAARADVEVRRYGAENPMVTIAKSTMWGGLAGLILGGATALVAGENEDDIIKWFFVGGVFVGCGVGIYHVATRPEPTASLLQIDGDGLAVNFPTVRFSPERVTGAYHWRGTVTLFSLGF
jgi:hypothetical protein